MVEFARWILVMCTLGTVTTINTATESTKPSTSSLSSLQKKIIGELSWPVKMLYFKELGDKTRRRMLTNEVSRRVGIQALRQHIPLRQGDEPVDEEENSMKVKLFRLMYETVLDSDLKVKRAELIKNQYVNSTAFEIGYLMGDVTDKQSVMQDISHTLNRLASEWKPVEHINAYEQMVNLAIEISHLIDMMRTASHKVILNNQQSTTTSSPLPEQPPAKPAYF